MKLLKITTLVISLLSVSLSAGSVDDGVVALKGGNYERAMQKFTDAANNGDKIARYNLSVMYNEGLGVVEDKERATYWIKMAKRVSVLDTNYGCQR